MTFKSSAATLAGTRITIVTANVSTAPNTPIRQQEAAKTNNNNNNRRREVAQNEGERMSNKRANKHRNPLKKLNSIRRQLLFCGFIASPSSSSIDKRETRSVSKANNHEHSSTQTEEMENEFNLTRGGVTSGAKYHKQHQQMMEQSAGDCCLALNSLRNQHRSTETIAMPSKSNSCQSDSECPLVSHLVKMMATTTREASTTTMPTPTKMDSGSDNRTGCEQSCKSYVASSLKGSHCALVSSSSQNWNHHHQSQNDERGPQWRASSQKASSRDTAAIRTANSVNRANKRFYGKSSFINRSSENKRVDRMEQLIELLNQYAKRNETQQSSVMELGMPSTTRLSFTSNEPSIDDGGSTSGGCSFLNEDLFWLEDNWTSFVQLQGYEDSPVLFCLYPNNDNNDQPARESERQHMANLKSQQDAIWELLTTEVIYIKRIRVMMNLFLATLANLQQHSLLVEIEAKQLSGNIDEIYEANCSFWINHMQPMLAKSRSTHRPLDPIMMKNAFVQIRSMFNPYYKYCLEHTSCLKYVKEQNRSNEYFKVYVAWCESQKDCERLKLMDLLANPMQRLTRYSLLLNVIAKKTDNHEQYMALEKMIVHTNRFVFTVDLELRRQDDHKRLISTASRIDTYDIGTDVYNDEIDKLVKSYCQFDITTPLFNCPFKCRRQLLFDSQLHTSHNIGTNFGQLKFKDAQVSGKLDIVLLIFTDHLFICKQAGNSKWHHSSSHKANQSNNHSPTRTPLAMCPNLSELSGQQVKSAPAHSCSFALNIASHLSPNQLRPRAGSQSNELISSPSIGQTSQHQHTSRHSTNMSPRALSLILSEARGLNQNNNTTIGSYSNSYDNSASDQHESLIANKNYQAAWNADGQVSQNNGDRQTYSLRATNEWTQKRPYTTSSTSQLVTSDKCSNNNNNNSSNIDNNNKRAFHSSSSSVIGNVARELFMRSNDTTSRSGDQEQSYPLKVGSGSNEARLRVIRSPYPIERLVMHELKDGQGVFCCQLNDSLTIANSFILYIPSNSNDSIKSNQDQQQQSRVSQYLWTNNTNQESCRSTVGCGGDQENVKNHLAALSRQQGLSKQQQLKRVSPAKQLINLIKQAQVRYQFAALFHGANLANVDNSGIDHGGVSPNKPNADLVPKPDDVLAHCSNQNPQGPRLNTWSSFRRHSRADKFKSHPKVRGTEPSDSSIIKQHSSENWKSHGSSQKHFLLTSRSASSENQPTIFTNETSPILSARNSPNSANQRATKQSNPILKAIIEQHQSMLFNHNLYDELSTYDYIIIDHNHLCVFPKSDGESPGEPVTEERLLLRDPSSTRVSIGYSREFSQNGSQSSVFEGADPRGDICDQEKAFKDSNLSPMSQDRLSLAFLSHGQDNAQANEDHQQLLSPNRYNSSNSSGINYNNNNNNNNNNNCGGRQIGDRFFTSQKHAIGRRHFSRSARVSTNLEMSCDYELNQISETKSVNWPSTTTTSFNSSVSSTRSSSPFLTMSGDSATDMGQPYQLQRGTVTTNSTMLTFNDNQDPGKMSVGRTKGSSRKLLSLLRRQNVILSVSSDQHQQHLEGQMQQQQSDGINGSYRHARHLFGQSQSKLAADSNNASFMASSNTVPPHQTVSQATTMDQTSGAFDDSNINFMAEPRAAVNANQDCVSACNDTSRATSFKLVNLRNRNCLSATDFDSSHRSERDDINSARSASVETRSPISVTLTLPNNDGGGSNMDEGNQRRQQQQQLFCLHTNPISMNASKKNNDDDQLAMGDADTLIYLNLTSKETKTSPTQNADYLSVKRRTQGFSPMISSPNSSILQLNSQSQANKTSGVSIGQARSGAISPPGNAILSKLRRMFNQNIEPAPLKARIDERQNETDPSLPVLNVITASPQDLNLSREFSSDYLNESIDYYDHQAVRRSSEILLCLSSPDWDKLTDIRRTSSTSELKSMAHKTLNNPSKSGSCSSLSNSNNGSKFSSPGARLLKRCNTFSLVQHRTKDKPFRTDLIKTRNTSSNDLKSLELLAMKQIRLDGYFANHLSDYESKKRSTWTLQSAALSQESACAQYVNNPLSQPPLITDDNQVIGRAKKNETMGYLGFHEKLDLHKKRQEEGSLQADEKHNVSGGVRLAFSQLRLHKSPASIKRSFLSKSHRHPLPSTNSFFTGRSYRALKLTRSMTAEIFDSFLRATPLRKMSGRKAN